MLLEFTFTRARAHNASQSGKGRLCTSHIAPNLKKVAMCSTSHGAEKIAISVPGPAGVQVGFKKRIIFLCIPGMSVDSKWQGDAVSNRFLYQVNRQHIQISKLFIGIHLSGTRSSPCFPEKDIKQNFYCKELFPHSKNCA